MEFLLVFGIHFLIMGAIVLAISGILSCFIPPPYIWTVVLVSVIAGYLYTEIFEVSQMALFSILFNGSLSILAIGLVSMSIYIKKIA